MPNWCYSRLYVSGPDDDVRAFLTAWQGEVPPREKDPVRPRSAKGGHIIRPYKPVRRDARKNAIMPFAFSRLVPMPKKLEKKSDAVVFGWRIENWGCRWSPAEVEIERQSAGRTRFWIRTPWAPPIPLFENVSQLFPRLRFGLHYVVEGDELGFTRLWFRKGRQVDAKGRPRPAIRYRGWL